MNGGRKKTGDRVGQLVEFPLADGSSVLVEVHPTAAAGSPVTRGIGPSDVVDRAHRSFEDAIDRIQPAAQAIITRLRQLPQTPDEVRVEFGLDLHAEAGAFIAAASSTANFKIVLTWRAGH
jgi:Trypsin-co-occurring domain 1